MITVRLPDGSEANDEIGEFVHRRYISATYAHWRIQEYEMVKMNPSVMKLKLHDECQQEVYSHQNMTSIEASLLSSERTMLTEYFSANTCPTRGEIARTLLYENFPARFAWNESQKIWTVTQVMVQCYGRIDSVQSCSICGYS